MYPDQKGILTKDDYEEYLVRILQPSYEQTIMNIEIIQQCANSLHQQCSAQLNYLQSNAMSSQRKNVDGRDGTFPLGTVNHLLRVAKSSKQLVNLFNVLEDVAQTCSDSNVIVRKKLTFNSLLDGCVEDVNSRIATSGNTRAKDVSTYVFARTKMVRNVFRKQIDDGFSTKRHKKQIYVNTARLRHGGKVDKATSVAINSEFAPINDKYYSIKQNKDIPKIPAIKEYLYLFRPEPCDTLRGTKKKPIGASAFDFRQRSTTILNQQQYALQLTDPINSASQISSTIVIDAESVVVVNGNNRMDNKRFFRTITAVTSAAIDINDDHDPPIQGHWMQHNGNGYFSIYTWQTDVVTINLTQVVSEAENYMVFKLDRVSGGVGWKVRDVHDFEIRMESINNTAIVPIISQEESDMSMTDFLLNCPGVVSITNVNASGQQRVCPEPMNVDPLPSTISTNFTFEIPSVSNTVTQEQTTLILPPSQVPLGQQFIGNVCLKRQIQNVTDEDEMKPFHTLHFSSSSVQYQQQIIPIAMIQFPMYPQTENECAIFASYASSVFNKYPFELKCIASHISLNMNDITNPNHVWTEEALISIDYITEALADQTEVTQYMDNANKYFQPENQQHNDCNSWEYIQNKGSLDIERYCVQTNNNNVTVLDYPTRLMQSFEDGVAGDLLEYIYMTMEDEDRSDAIITNTCRVGSHWRCFYIIKINSTFCVFTTDSKIELQQQLTAKITTDLFSLIFHGYGLFYNEDLKIICGTIRRLQETIGLLNPSSSIFVSTLASEINQIINTGDSTNWKTNANEILNNVVTDELFDELVTKVTGSLNLNEDQLAKARSSDYLTLPTQVSFNAYSSLPINFKKMFVGLNIHRAQCSVRSIDKNQVLQKVRETFDTDDVIARFINTTTDYVLQRTADQLLKNENTLDIDEHIDQISKQIKEYSYGAGWNALT